MASYRDNTDSQTREEWEEEHKEEINKRRKKAEEDEAAAKAAAWRAQRDRYGGQWGRGRKYVTNPKTGRRILVGGATYKKMKGGKRKLNAYFKLMLDAKKKNKKSFTYKGKTYKKTTSPNGKLTLYKKA